ncbi:MAG: hypothetical protein WAT92_24140 [Saprospiraceae bacterium]
MKKFKNWLTFSSLIMLSYSCTKDKVIDKPLNCETNVTYITDIKPIIDNSCAYSGCHVSSFSNGNYTSYNTMKNSLLSGSFEKWVLRDRQMPPADAPVGKPKTLTEAEIELITCWKDNGYAEK